MIEPVSAGVCRVTQSAWRCLSLSTTDRHAGPPGGKAGLLLSVALRRAERQARDFPVTCSHQPHTYCLPLCYAKVFDPAWKAGHVQERWWWWNVWHVQVSVSQYLATWEMARLARRSFIIINYRLKNKSDGCSVLNLMTLLWLFVGLHPAKHRVVLSRLPKFGS